MTAALEAAGVEVEDYARCSEAVDAEPMPAVGFEPTAEPLERQQSGKKGKHCADQAGYE